MRRQQGIQKETGYACAKAAECAQQRKSTDRVVFRDRFLG
jgi:hypothetical protein